MIDLSTNETLLLHALSAIMAILGFFLGMFLERRKWIKVFRAAILYRKGVTDLSTTRALKALRGMGFTAAEAAKGFGDLGKSGVSVYPKKSFPPVPLPPRLGGYVSQTGEPWMKKP